MKFATRLRLLLFLSIALMMTPTILLMTGVLTRPPMWEGDRLEERPCPQCQGRKCAACRNRGRAHYILPGPHRPTRFAG
ncbi:MAG: hypothetical protein AB1758_27125, partial [Candidatus Eremiobacterota bacterium]